MEDNSGEFVGLGQQLGLHPIQRPASNLQKEGTMLLTEASEKEQVPLLSIPEKITFDCSQYTAESEFTDVYVISEEQNETSQLHDSVIEDVNEEDIVGDNIHGSKQSLKICDNENKNNKFDERSMNDNSADKELVFVSQQYNKEEIYLDQDTSKENVGVLRTHNLDDFIDVVTTYKCRFCRFSCAWKAGLQSHIRNCHLSVNNGPPAKSARRKTICEGQKKGSKSTLKSGPLDNDSDITSVTTLENQPMQTDPGAQTHNNKEPTEKHIFLCGECSKGFDTLYLCKQHMVKDHDFTDLDSFLSVNQTGKKAQRRFGFKRKPQEISEGEDDSDPDDPTSSGGYNRRTLKTPKNLMVDFLIDNRKKRDIDEKLFRCNEAGCGSRFMLESNLEYHSQCHLAEDNMFACPECNERFDHWRRLLMHLWKEHLIDLDLLTCEECGYKTHSQFKLATHQKIHGEARDYMCHTCGKSFKQVSQLRNHSIIHMDRHQRDGDGPKRWYNTQECDVCGRTFSDSKCLRKHQQAVHSKIKPFVCTFCGHTSARKAMMQLHMRQHTGEKPFSCEHCEYKTGDHNSLRRHRMRHTGSKPYKCAHCPYACIQAISLKTHLKNKHPGLDGLYACGICGFHTVRKDNFAQHMSDHKRGILPATDDAQPLKESEPPQLHLSEGASEQLNGNMVSAQLICSCLNVLTQDGEAVDLPPGVITTGENGTQTITIQIPTSADQETGEQYYFTIQQDVTPDCLTDRVTELDLLENSELKLPDDEEDLNVSDFIVSEPCELQHDANC